MHFGVMDSYVCVWLVMLPVIAIGQNYKVFGISGKGTETFLDQYGITPKDNKLIFEIKGCFYGDIDFDDKKDETKTYKYFIRFNNTGDGHITITTSYIDDIQYNHEKGCDTFIKMKLQWKDANFMLWSYHVTGWKTIYNWNETSSVLDEVEYLEIENEEDMEWRVYAIEHSTSPHTVICIN